MQSFALWFIILQVIFSSFVFTQSLGCPFNANALVDKREIEHFVS